MSMLVSYVSTTLFGEQGLFYHDDDKKMNDNRREAHLLIVWWDLISGIMPEVSIDPMKVVEEAVLEFSDKKDLFVAYMSSMIVGDQGITIALCKIIIFIISYYCKSNSI